MAKKQNKANNLNKNQQQVGKKDKSSKKAKTANPVQESKQKQKLDKQQSKKPKSKKNSQLQQEATTATAKKLKPELPTSANKKQIKAEKPSKVSKKSLALDKNQVGCLAKCAWGTIPYLKKSDVDCDKETKKNISKKQAAAAATKIFETATVVEIKSPWQILDVKPNDQMLPILKDMPALQDHAKASKNKRKNCTTAVVKLEMPTTASLLEETKTVKVPKIVQKEMKRKKKRAANWLKFVPSSERAQTQLKEEQAAKLAAAAATKKSAICRPGTLYSDVLAGTKKKSKRLAAKISKAQQQFDAAMQQSSLEQKELCACAATCIEMKTEDLGQTLQAANNAPEKEMQTANSAAYMDMENLNESTPVMPVSVTAEVPQVSRICSQNSSALNDVIEKAIMPILKRSNRQKFKLPAANYIKGQPSFNFQRPNKEPKPKNKHNRKSQSRRRGELLKQQITANANKPKREPLTFNIEPWNFSQVDYRTENFPFFLCQFDDEHYMRAEQLSIVSLKLALGNISLHDRMRNYGMKKNFYKYRNYNKQ